MADAYRLLFDIALGILSVFLLACLIRVIRGPRIADRIIAVNMTSTLMVIIICILSFRLGEGYLTDVAMIYTMLGFLAVVLLSKIYMGVYHEKRRQEGGEHRG